MLKVKKLLEKIATNLKIISTGLVTDVSVPANGYTDVSVNFGKTYKSNPTVNVSLLSTSTAGAIGNMTAAVLSVTTTGATFRIFNAGTNPRQPSIQWIAIGGGYCIAVFSRLSAILARRWRYVEYQENLAENLAISDRSAKADDAFSTAFRQPTERLDVHGASRRNIVSRVRVISKNLHQRNMERSKPTRFSDSATSEHFSVGYGISSIREKRRRHQREQSFRQVFSNEQNGIRSLQVPRLTFERGCFSC